MDDAHDIDLVYSIARLMLQRGYIPAPVAVEDVAQAGMVAALEARKRYDGARGASWRTFVAIRIRGAIRDEVDRQMRKYAEDSYEVLEEINQAPGHRLTPERVALYYERFAQLACAIDRLPPRWQKLLALRYKHDWTQREIAAEWGITEARVSQMHAEIVRRLRA